MVNEIVKMGTYFLDFLKVEGESARITGWTFHILKSFMLITLGICRSFPAIFSTFVQDLYLYVNNIID